MERYRNEWKFLVTQGELEVIRRRILPVMKPDVHQKGDCYNIRSLYFDDWQNSCMEENEAGVDRRDKYRIRIYDKSDSLIHLERKSKTHGMTSKKSCSLSVEECSAYLSGRVPPVSAGEQTKSLMREFNAKIRMRRMRPVCIVEYERSAYIYRHGNVRVTFDRNIGAGFRTKDFFEEHTALVPVLPAGRHVLEVKFDEFLPDFLAQLLETGTLERTSFSKYYLCRAASMWYNCN